MGSFDADTFVTTYLPIPVFFILLVVYKLVKKTKIVKYQDMDFISGCSADIPLDVSQSFPCNLSLGSLLTGFIVAKSADQVEADRGQYLK